MQVVIRVDASQRIGTGHLVRCKTLAEVLRQRGASVRFICREHQGHLIDWLLKADFQVTGLPIQSPPSLVNDLSEDYQAWLGVTPEQDSQETIQAIGNNHPDWLIIDHYGIDQQWETQLRPHVQKILVIDDLANRCHDCDVLLDQNNHLGEIEAYLGLVPKSCHLLLGPRYALLNSIYTKHRHQQPPRQHPARRLLLFFGGTDHCGLTSQSLEALSSASLEHLTVDIVIGTSNPLQSKLEQQAAARPNTIVHYSRPHLADLMSQADLALGAGGTTTWERCCLGLPALVVSIANNQIPTCQALDKVGAIAYLGTANQVTPNILKSALIELVNDASRLIKISHIASLQTDGLGVHRVVEYLTPSASEQLRLRPATAADISLYYDWVNDSEVRRQSIKTAPVNWQEHQAWYDQKLSSNICIMRVLEVNELPIGQIRWDFSDNQAFMSYSLDPIARGRGWASLLIKMGINQVRQYPISLLSAKVKPGNPASQAALKRAGFQEAQNSQDNEHLLFHLSL